MPKNKTPLLRPLRKNGATLYVFPSASEDIGLNINNGTTGVALSHYALLNLTTDNFPFTSAEDIVESLQNYAMNFETVLINDENYNFQESYTVSESVFWHWIKDKCWKKNNFSRGDLFQHLPNNTSNIYRETNYQTGNANRIVQCFGSIDSGNSLSTDFGMFNETYVTIPTSYGNGPVFFRVANDNENFNSQTTYSVKSTNNLEGRSDIELTYLSNNKPEVDNENGYNDENPIEIIKDIPTIQSALRTLSGDSTISISSYDDINIDQNGLFTADNLADYDMTTSECEFKFNAILLYYSIYDMNDAYKQSVATNLFGIVFLDGGSSAENGSGYLLTPMTKKKSYTGQTDKNAYFGNSFSFRVNIKTLSVYDNTDARIDDNTTTTSAYAVDFNDVISNLNRAIDVMNTNVQTTMAIQDKYTTILAYYSEIKEKLESIETNLDMKISDNYTNAITELKKEINEKIEAAVSTVDSTTVSSDGSPLEGDVRNLRKPNVVYSQNRTLRAENYAVDDHRKTFGNGNIADTKINIVSASSVDVVADTKLSLTSEEIKFNIKEGDEKLSVSFTAILGKLKDLNDAIESLKKEQQEQSKAIAGNSSNTDETDTTLKLGAVKVSDNVEQEQHADNESSEEISTTEVLINAGIIPVTGILKPRERKPSESGYYLKQDTSGNITSCVLFDGTDYSENAKCQMGKLYSMKGLLYVFNGETCKLLGQN